MLSTTQNRNRRIRRGFTLIELLLVMVIISILAAIVVPKFVGRKKDAQIAAAKQDIATMSTQLQAFEIDNGRFPTQEEGLQALVQNPGNLSNWHSLLPKVPLDPWGRPYVYHCPGANGADFDLLCTGESGQEGNADNIPAPGAAQ
ncbi:MAG: type II secretion system major pseudopilin GspG [Tepidisphaeraceae bacterium]